MYAHTREKLYYPKAKTYDEAIQEMRNKFPDANGYQKVYGWCWNVWWYV